MRLEFEQPVSTFPLAETESLDEISISPDFENLLKKGIAAAQSGDRDQARVLLTKAAAYEPRSEDAWMWLASISEYPEELLAFLNNVLNINPENERALEWRKATISLLAKTLVQRGVSAHAEGKSEMAAQCFEQAILHDSECEMAWFWKASLTSDHDQREALLDRVLAINPENQDAKNELDVIAGARIQAALDDARSAAERGDSRTALELLGRVFEAEPNKVSAWELKARVAEDTDDKLEALEKVLELDPENQSAKAEVEAIANARIQTAIDNAKAAADSGDTESALKMVGHVISAAPENVNAWLLKGSLLSDMDGQAEAFNKVLELDPQNTEATAELAEIEKKRSQSAVADAKAAAVTGDTATALTILAQALAVAPDNLDAWMLRSHLAMGMQDKLEALERVLELDPDNAAARSSYDFLASTTRPAEPVAEEPQIEAAEEPAVEAAPETVLESALEPVFETADEPKTEDLAFANAVTDDHEIEVSQMADAEPALSEKDYAYTETVTLHAADLEEAIDKDPDVAPVEERAADAPVDPFHITEEPVEGGRSAEQMFGPVDDEIDADSDTVEKLSPWADLAEHDAGYTNGNAHHVDDLASSDDIEFTVPADAATESFDQMSAVALLTGVSCPFCSSMNEPQSFECSSCAATLSLSDIGSLLGNNRANREVIQNAVTQMEGEWNLREFDEKEMTSLALGHFNLQNFEPALKYLQEASRLNPNDVILAGQVNAVAIRLDEMRRQDENRESMPKGKTILVVDDSPTVRKLISGKLEKAGHTVVCAVDGVDALAKLESELPDLVLLDITMPRMDGYEVCKQIRSDPAAKGLPVVMISGKDGFFDKVRGRMAGTTGYITKPFGPETLMKAIETYLVDSSGSPE